MLYRLLLADDEIESRLALSRYYPWSDVGFEIVDQVSNGKEALDFLARNPVDAVLCDIRMPVMDGVAVARHLYEGKSRIKVIFLSGFRDFEYVQQALQYGVRNYILKPTKYDEITEVFSKLRSELDQERLEGSGRGAESHFENQTIQQVVDFISAFMAQATLETVAQRVHMNPTYFSQYFKKQTGRNFSEYLTDVKMQKAVRLLEADERINDIASQVGYSSAKAFSRAFANFYGCSPTEYKLRSRLKI